MKQIPRWIYGIGIVIIMLFLIYIYFMVVAPLQQGKGSWGYLQNTWNAWQTLNGAVLALFAAAGAVSATIWSLHRRYEMDHALLERQENIANREKEERKRARLGWLCWRVNPLLYSMKIIALNGSPPKAFDQIRSEMKELEPDIFEVFGETSLMSLKTLLGHVEAIVNPDAVNKVNPSGVAKSADAAVEWLLQCKHQGAASPYLFSYQAQTLKR